MTIIKALIFGNYDALSLSLIARLKKENHQVFFITDEKKQSKTPPGVFQEYTFSFESESINYILNAVQPDVVIYKGVYDAIESINDDTSQLKSVIAGLTNAIVNCKKLNIKHFVYLSSTRIFNDKVERMITTDLEPLCHLEGDRASYIGERIIQGYNDAHNMAITITRLGEVYGVHKKHYLENNVIISMIQEAQQTGQITVHEDRHHHLIYIDDVVDYIYRITLLSEVKQSIHHITPVNEVGYSETEISQKILQLMDEEKNMHVPEVVEKTEAVPVFQHVYKKRQDDQLEVYEKYDLDKGLTTLYKIGKDSQKKFFEQEKAKSSLRDRFNLKNTSNNVRNLFENVLFLVLIQLFIILTRDFSFHESIDVYLIYVIIIAVIYGYLQAVFAVAFSAVGKIYIDLVMGSRYIEFSGYEIYLWIIQIFTVGVLIGYLKDKYRRRYADYMDERDYLSHELEILKDINESNVKIKNEYENRLLNYSNSFARIYELISRFDAIEPERVIFKSIHVISEIVKSQDVSIYSYDNESEYCRMMAASSEKAKSFGKTIKLSDYQKLYKKVLLGEIYVNNDLNSDYPMLVGGTYDNGHLNALIMIWSLPFESFNLYEKNNFAVMCTLVGSTIMRAHVYMDNINDSYNLTAEHVLTPEAFSNIVQIYVFGEEESVVDYTILTVSEEQVLEEHEVIEIIKQQVRDTDYVGMNTDGQVQVLLTNTNSREADYVVNRLNDRQIEVAVNRSMHELNNG